MFEGFQFQNSEYLYGLIIIPFLTLLFVIFLINKNKAFKKFGKIKVISALMPDFSYGRPILKFLMLNFALLLIIIAIARPQFGTQLKEVKTKSAEVVIALDISNSMLTKDKKNGISRLKYAKNIINKIINNLQNDRVALVVFAGEAYLQVPLTSDYAALRMILSSIEPDFITAQGTAIADAINLSSNSFSPTNKSSKTIIVISDGENHEGNIEAVINEAKNNTIVIHTIGIGSAKGNPIPDPKNPNNYIKNKAGEIVVSKLNEEMLFNIAKQCNGHYVNAIKNSNSLKQIFNSINKSEKSEITTYAKYDEKYHYFIFIALILVFIEFLFLSRKNKWLKKIKLFK